MENNCKGEGEGMWGDFYLFFNFFKCFYYSCFVSQIGAFYFLSIEAETVKINFVTKEISESFLRRAGPKLKWSPF